MIELTAQQFYRVSIADFRDELAKFKAERTKKGGA